MYYGIPEKILSDEGRNFASSLIAELCKLTGVKKLRTTPYRPQTNGQCEKFNSTLINIIGTLPSELKYNWQEHVNTLVHAYKCMDTTSTNFSPHYLMFGREPNLPIDIEFGVRTPDLVATSTKNYVEKLQKRLVWAYKKAQEVNHKENKRNKRIYDKKIRCTKLEVGDKVLVRQKAFKKKHKIQDKWEEDVYVVVAQPNNNFPVFIVLNERSQRSRTLHRNMLFPLGQELQCEDIGQRVEVFYPKIETQNTKENSGQTNPEKEDSDGEISESEKNTGYKGPMTSAKTKGLEQANVLMIHYFSP